MRLVADANVLVAAFLRDSTVRRIVMLSDVQLLVPEFIFEEIEKHLPELSRRAGLDSERSSDLLERLRKRLIVIPEDLISAQLRTALREMERIDPKDAPYLAAALAVASEGIWSDDPHMKRQALVPCYTTVEVLERIRTDRR